MKIARLAAPVAALLLMAGCATPTGGTAFNVDGVNTSTDAVETATTGCETLVEADPGAISGQVAQMLLYGSLADAISQRSGVAITNQDQAKALAALQGGPLTKDPDCAVAVNGMARYAAITGKLGQDKSREQLRALDVQVNPRYGSWNPADGTFTGATGSLSMQDMGQGKVFGG